MKNKPVWIDGIGDVRKEKAEESEGKKIDKDLIMLNLRRLTSGKGRTVIEISNLPGDKTWSKELSKNLKKKLGCGGSFKNGVIEIHGEKTNEVSAFLDKHNIKWKKTGG